MKTKPKMERQYHLLHQDPDGDVVEDKVSFYHDAEFTLGNRVFFDLQTRLWLEVAEVNDKLEMTVAKERWRLRRVS